MAAGHRVPGDLAGRGQGPVVPVDLDRQALVDDVADPGQQGVALRGGCVRGDGTGVGGNAERPLPR
ncbi:hypothetical protein L615_001100000140 [Nocardioides sp. J9]|nr:hypothetical protein L615_001100000140 [Nocardioides sp. J9]